MYCIELPFLSHQQVIHLLFATEDGCRSSQTYVLQVSTLKIKIKLNT